MRRYYDLSVFLTRYKKISFALDRLHNVQMLRRDRIRGEKIWTDTGFSLETIVPYQEN